MNKTNHLIAMVLFLGLTPLAFIPILAQAQVIHNESALYYCPMHPTYTSNQPGKCPICNMDLVKQQTSDQSAEQKGNFSLSEVSINKEKQDLLNIKTISAIRQNIEKELRLPARITPDETHLYHIHTKVNGYIEKLYVNFVGQHVAKDEPLFSVYAPDLLVAQNEFIQALKTTPGERSKSLIETTRNRLLIQDVPPNEIAELEKTLVAKRDIIFRSPIDGFITQKTAIHGMRVTPDMILYDVADLSSIWVIADSYEMDLPFVDVGQAADIKFTYLPEKSFHGTVSYIYPEVSEETRTIKIRIELKNPTFELKPGMFGEVTIKKSFDNKLIIPASALIYTGKRNLVFVKKDDTTFEPREVKLGLKTDNYYQVLEGLKEGDIVVFEGNFLLDSEAKLKAARWNTNPSDHH